MSLKTYSCSVGRTLTDTTVGRSVSYQLDSADWNQPEEQTSGYLLHALPYGQVWHKALFRWVRAQGRSSHAPGISKKYLRPRRHSPYKGRLRRRAINPTSPKRVKAWGEGPLRLKEISRNRDTLGQIRAPDNTAGEVLLSTWRGPDRNQSVVKMIWTGSKEQTSDLGVKSAQSFKYKHRDCKNPILRWANHIQANFNCWFANSKISFFLISWWNDFCLKSIYCWYFYRTELS